MDSERATDVMVVGGGTAGLIAACLLATWNSDLRVQVVRSSDIPTIGVGEGTTSAVPYYLHEVCGIDYGSFIAESGALWKLGVEFDWGAPGTEPFSFALDAKLAQPEAGIHTSIALQHGDDRSDLSLFSALIAEDKAPYFQHAESEQPIHTGGFGYHVDNEHLLTALESACERRGVELIDAEITSIELDESGDVAAVQTRCGQTLQAPLWVDASGFGQLLLSCVGGRNRSYADSLLCDRAIVGKRSRRAGESIRSATSAPMLESGWMFRIENRDHLSFGYVHAGDFIDEDAAQREFEDRSGVAVDDMRTLRFESRRAEESWVRNVVAVGNSAGFLEPLAATAIHLSCVAAANIAGAVRESGTTLGPAAKGVFNRKTAALWDETRDFIATHYRFNTKGTSPFWQLAVNDTCLGAAEGYVDYYREVGPTGYSDRYFIDPRDSMFGHNGYAVLLTGMGLEHAGRLQPSEQDIVRWGEVRETIAAASGAALSMDSVVTQNLREPVACTGLRGLERMGALR